MNDNRCCKGCVPPKRSAEPNCHSYCKEYLEECIKIREEKEKLYELKRKEIVALPTKVYKIRNGEAEPYAVARTSKKNKE